MGTAGDDWEFHYAPKTVALASHIALLDAGVAPKLRRLDFSRAEQQGDAYRRVNPKMRVPTLVTEDGALTETPAILAFVAQRFPEAGLAPAEPFAFAKLQEFMGYVASTLHVAHAHGMRGHRWVDPADTAAIEAMKAKVPETVADAFRFVEEHYPLSPFVLGDRYSVADPYLFTVSGWMKGDGVPDGLLPRVEAHRETMMSRETVREALRQQSA